MHVQDHLFTYTVADVQWVDGLEEAIVLVSLLYACWCTLADILKRAIGHPLVSPKGWEEEELGQRAAKGTR